MADIILYVKDKDNKKVQEFVITDPSNVIADAPKGTYFNIELRERGYKGAFVGHYIAKDTELATNPDPVCPKGQHLENGKCVPDVIPDPTPGEFLYNSDTDIPWASLNGQKKVIKDIYAPNGTKPNSKYIRCNASGSPTLTLDPSDKSVSLTVDGGGKHGRLYFGVCNFDCVLEKESVFDAGTDNDSDKTNSRHQYRDEVDSKASDKQVQGGCGNAWHRNEVDQKIEVVHGGSTACSKSGSIKLETGKPYKTRFTVKHDKSKKSIYQLAELEYPIGSGYKKVLEQNCTSAPDQFFNEQEFIDWSEFWLRNNTGSKKGTVKHKHITVKKI